MRVGIDATALPSPQFGAGNYIVHLIRALARSDSTHQFVVFVKPAQSALFDHLQLERVIVPLPSRLWRIVWEQTRLPALAKKQQLDILHSPHYTMPFRKACRSIVTFHDMTFFLYPEMHLWYKPFFFGAMTPLSARRADALIAISASTRDDTVRLFNVNPEKIFTIPYGIDPAFHPIADARVLSATCEKYHLPEKFFLYVGNLEPRKNVPMLLRAFARIAHPDQEMQLVVAGSRGWKDAEIFSTLKALGLEKRVSFPGFIPQDDLPAVYHQAEAFVYPSLYEGFGLPVLEAMACGLPVITSNISSMPEITGDAAILIDPQSEAELSAALESVLTDRVRRDRLARSGLARAQEFSWERAAKETLAVYERF